MGNLAAARPHVSVLGDLAGRKSTRRRAASSGFAVVTHMASLEGNWKGGRESNDRGLELTPLNPSHLWTRAIFEHQTGDSAEGDVYLDRLLEAARLPGPEQSMARGMAAAAAVVARITGEPKRLDMAEAAAEAVRSEKTVSPLFAQRSTAGLALLAVQKGGQSAAAEYYAALLDKLNTMIYTVISAGRLLGLLSQTMGNEEQAVRHFEDALAFCRQAGFRPELAWTGCDYADLLMAGLSGPSTNSGRTDGGGRAKAMTLLEESLTISTQLGMRPLMERVIERQEQARSQPEPAHAYPGGLTEREVEVLRLIAAGKTNFEIAEELVIAEGTARRHVANIYEKIGAANRVEAAAYAAQYGLV